MQATKLMIEKADRYCKKSLDTKEEFLNSNYNTFVKEFKNEAWCEYSIEKDIFWIHTVYCENDTIKRWSKIIQLAKDYGCKSIQFLTKRNAKLWQKKFGFKPIAYVMEYNL